MNDPSIVPISMKGRFANALRGRYVTKAESNKLFGLQRRDLNAEFSVEPAQSRASVARLLAPRTLKLRNPLCSAGELALASGPTGAWPLAETLSPSRLDVDARPRTSAYCAGLSPEQLFERRRLLASQKRLLEARCADARRAAFDACRAAWKP